MPSIVQARSRDSLRHASREYRGSGCFRPGRRRQSALPCESYVCNTVTNHTREVVTPTLARERYRKIRTGMRFRISHTLANTSSHFQEGLWASNKRSSNYGSQHMWWNVYLNVSRVCVYSLSSHALLSSVPPPLLRVYPHHPQRSWSACRKACSICWGWTE